MQSGEDVNILAEVEPYRGWLISGALSERWVEFRRDFLDGARPDRFKTLEKSTIVYLVNTYAPLLGIGFRAPLTDCDRMLRTPMPDKTAWTVTDHYMRYIVTVARHNYYDGPWSPSEYQRRADHVVSMLFDFLFRRHALWKLAYAQRRTVDIAPLDDPLASKEESGGNKDNVEGKANHGIREPETHDELVHKLKRIYATGGVKAATEDHKTGDHEVGGGVTGVADTHGDKSGADADVSDEDTKEVSAATLCESDEDDLYPGAPLRQGKDKSSYDVDRSDKDSGYTGSCFFGSDGDNFLIEDTLREYNEATSDDGNDDSEAGDHEEGGDEADRWSGTTLVNSDSETGDAKASDHGEGADDDRKEKGTDQSEARTQPPTTRTVDVGKVRTKSRSQEIMAEGARVWRVRSHSV